MNKAQKYAETMAQPAIGTPVLKIKCNDYGNRHLTLSVEQDGSLKIRDFHVESLADIELIRDFLNEWFGPTEAASPPGAQTIPFCVALSGGRIAECSASAPSSEAAGAFRKVLQESEGAAWEKR